MNYRYLFALRKNHKLFLLVNEVYLFAVLVDCVILVLAKYNKPVLMLANMVNNILKQSTYTDGCITAHLGFILDRLCLCAQLRYCLYFVCHKLISYCMYSRPRPSLWTYLSALLVYL